MSAQAVQTIHSPAASSSTDSDLQNFYSIPLSDEPSSPTVGVQFISNSEENYAFLKFIHPGNGQLININLYPDLEEKFRLAAPDEQREVVKNFVREVAKTHSSYVSANAGKIVRMGELNASLAGDTVKFKATALIMESKFGKRTARSIVKFFNAETSYGVKKIPVEIESFDLPRRTSYATLVGRYVEEYSSFLGILDKSGKDAMSALLSAGVSEREAILKEHLPALQAQGVYPIIYTKNERVKVLLGSQRMLGVGGFKICMAAIKLSGKEVGKLKYKVTFDPVGPEKIGGFNRDAESSVRHSSLLQANPEGRHLFAKYKNVSGKLFGSDEPHVKLTSDYANLGDLGTQLSNLTLIQQMHYIRVVLQAGSILESREFIHRDFKPENLLLADGRVIISDLGLMTEREKVKYSVKFAAMGTARYFPPHLPGIESVEYIMKQDSFATGLTLLEICTKGEFLPKHYFNTETSLSDPQRINFIRSYLNVIPDNPVAKVIFGLLDLFPGTRMKLTEAYTVIESLENAKFNKCLKKIDESFVNEILPFIINSGSFNI